MFRNETKIDGVEFWKDKTIRWMEINFFLFLKRERNEILFLYSSIKL